LNETLLLDCEGLSRLVRQERGMSAAFNAASSRNALAAVSSVTIVEAGYVKAHKARLHWLPSRLTVEPVTEGLARQASDLLHENSGLSGHKYAIDAIVAATARQLSEACRVTVLTSDPNDLKRLCGPGITIKRV
jgi:predicted nucleic acid-binding protein